MPTVPRFNENGLWRYESIFFSKHGNLKKTVVHLVTASSSGLTGKQIGDIVGLPARSFLHHFRDVPGLCRQKHEGVYVYYSDDADRYQQQVQNRSQIDEIKGICDMDAIAILVALIRRHRIGVEQILALPEIKSRGLSQRKIEVFMKSHGLEKKTPVSKP
jgi:hypothetical protein